VSETKLTIHGLDDLRQALLRLPAELVHEASVVVQANADDQKRYVEAEYAAHVKTGNLLRHLSVEVAVDAVSATARVKNNAFHAHFFESGAVRANRGTMKPIGHFVPYAILRRRAMVAALVELVERAGLTVQQR